MGDRNEDRSLLGYGGCLLLAITVVVIGTVWVVRFFERLTTQ